MRLRPVLAVEHRSHRRYPLKLQVQCRVAQSDQVYSGKIVDMSSGGICFACPEVFPRGTKIELAKTLGGTKIIAIEREIPGVMIAATLRRPPQVSKAVEREWLQILENVLG